MFCRLGAQEYSTIAPVLSQANVRLIGVGLEPLGVEEFVEKKFWAGGKVFLVMFLQLRNFLCCFTLYQNSNIRRKKIMVISQNIYVN